MYVIYVIDHFDDVTYLKVGPGRYPLPETWQASRLFVHGPCHLSLVVVRVITRLNHSVLWQQLRMPAANNMNPTKRVFLFGVAARKTDFQRRPVVVSTGESMSMGTDITILHDAYA